MYTSVMSQELSSIVNSALHLSCAQTKRDDPNEKRPVEASGGIYCSPLSPPAWASSLSMGYLAFFLYEGLALSLLWICLQTWQFQQCTQHQITRECLIGIC
jgi:hypothetical protein